MVRWYGRWLAPFFYVFMSLSLWASDPVVVTGTRKERGHEKPPGQNHVFQPVEATRFDINTQLQNIPSLQPIQTGSDPLSLEVPRIRGQEGRFCEVWLEEMLLVDPVLSYPLWVGLDLQALGRVSFYEGVSPYSLPSVHAQGALVFSRKPVSRSVRAEMGSAYGAPFGHSLWGLGQVRQARDSGTWKFQLYGRTHETDGRYPYYSDNGTPYMEEDDEILWRENNDARSWVVYPALSWEKENHRATATSLVYGGESGIPGIGDQPSTLRQKGSGQLHGGTYRYTLSSASPLAPRSVETQFLLRMDEKKTTGSYHGLVQEDAIQTGLQQAVMQGNWGEDHHVKGLLHVRYGSMDFAYRSSFGALQVKRESAVGYGGLLIPLASSFSLTLQSQLRGTWDQTKNRGLLEEGPSEPLSSSYGFTLAWEKEQTCVYASLGWMTRIPNLLERYGDGGAFAPSFALQPERVFHQELGIRSQVRGFWLGGAVFQDRVHDKITFVPSLMGSKALNLVHTRIRGVESFLRGSVGKVGVFTGIAYLDPASFLGERKYQIPGIAPWVFTEEVSYESGYVTPRWHTRYQSPVYRDPSNTIEVPGVWIHDASLDGKVTVGGGVLHVGIRIENLWDTKRGAIYSAREPIRKGYTAYSEVNGYPLPGRHGTLYIQAAL